MAAQLNAKFMLELKSERGRRKGASFDYSEPSFKCNGALKKNKEGSSAEQRQGIKCGRRGVSEIGSEGYSCCFRLFTSAPVVAEMRSS